MPLAMSLKKQIGMGLIESLIALLIISIGLLGIAALQITSLKQSSSSQWHSQAVWYSYEMTDRINANRTVFAQYGGIDTDNTYNQDCEGATCTPAQLVTADAQDWKDLMDTLPDGRGFISSTANTLTISVMWDEGESSTNCTNDVTSPNDRTCFTVTVAQ